MNLNINQVLLALEYMLIAVLHLRKLAIYTQISLYRFQLRFQHLPLLLNEHCIFLA